MSMKKALGHAMAASVFFILAAEEWRHAVEISEEDKETKDAWSQSSESD